MLVRFKESFTLPVEEVYDYFKSPADWARLYGLAGLVRQMSDGWTAVPLNRFPFPLVAKNTEVRPHERVRWTFKGFWRGEGEVSFILEADGRVTVEGFEEISVRWLGPFSPLVETLFLRKRFEFIWNLGWRRLRKRELPAMQPSAEIRGSR